MKVRFEVEESHIKLWEKNNDVRYYILMGGRGNGRSGTASRYAVSQLLSKEYTRGAIMRAVREDIRASCWGDILDRLREEDIESKFHITENDMYLGYGQNSIRAHGFRASSGSLTARLKSLAGYNFIWIEEAEEIGEKEFMTLDDTLRTIKGKIRIVLTLNTPPKNHWLIKKWFDLVPANVQGFNVDGFYVPKLKESVKDVVYIPGTFRENLPNLDEHTIKRYQEYMETKPAYYWQMIEGLSPEVVLGRIYSNWQKIQRIPHEARLLGYGLDFGFDPDPAAIIAIYYHNGGYIFEEKLYQTKLLNEHLAVSLKSWPKAPIVADNAEPKSISELQQHGLNVLPCEKGTDSVRHGIKFVQGFKISYIGENLHNEYENYAWKVNKDGEDVGIEDPKCANHLLSAARYGLSMLSGGSSGASNEIAEKQKMEVFISRRAQHDTR